MRRAGGSDKVAGMFRSRHGSARGNVRPRTLSVRDLSYGYAVLIGLAFAAFLVTPRMMIGRLPAGVIEPPDAAGLAGHAVAYGRFLARDPVQHLTGQLYFLHQPWHWPLFRVDRLAGGVSIALTDSIPLAALLLKLAHPAVPWMQQSLGPYLAFAIVLQPVAAVYALRGTARFDVVSAFAVAVMPELMAPLLFQTMEEALGGHYPILLALSLSLRLGRDVATARAAVTWRRVLVLHLLALLTLAIHPYLAAMILPIACGASLTLLARVGWRPALVGVAISAATLGLLRVEGIVLGLDTVLPVPAAQHFDLIARWMVLPALRHLVTPPDGVWRILYDPSPVYLGAGLMVLAIAAAAGAAVRRRAWAALMANPGLVAAMLILGAVSCHGLAIELATRGTVLAPLGRMLGQFRAALRLIWPAMYLLLVLSVRFAPGRWPGRAVLLAVCCVLQGIDLSWQMLQSRWLAVWVETPMSASERRFDQMLAGADRLVLRPTLACDPDRELTYPVLIYMAARRNVAVDETYLARDVRAASCAPGDEGPPPGASFVSPRRTGAVVTVLNGKYD